MMKPKPTLMPSSYPYPKYGSGPVAPVTVLEEQPPEDLVKHLVELIEELIDIDEKIKLLADGS